MGAPCIYCDNPAPHPGDWWHHAEVLAGAAERYPQQRNVDYRGPGKFVSALAAIVAHGGSDECLPFDGHLNAGGYGLLAFESHCRLAHRVIYVTMNGIRLPDIAGIVVRHTCDTPACFNPRHLRAGTQADNVVDMFSRGRQKAYLRGEANQTAKVPDKIVALIKSVHVRGDRNGFSAMALAKRFGIPLPTVYGWVTNRARQRASVTAAATKAGHTASAPRKVDRRPAAARSTARAPAAR